MGLIFAKTAVVFSIAANNSGWNPLSITRQVGRWSWRKFPASCCGIRCWCCSRSCVKYWRGRANSL